MEKYKNIVFGSSSLIGRNFKIFKHQKTIFTFENF